MSFELTACGRHGTYLIALRLKLFFMNFFNLKTVWTNSELIPLKVCIATAYILVGAYFHNFVRRYYLVFLIAFVITVVWSLYLWISKMKRDNA